MLCVREDIPAKLLSRDFPSAESFFTDINQYKKKWLVNCSYCPRKSNIGKHLDIVSRSLDALSTKYENIVILRDFNACVDDEALQRFWKFYFLHSLIKQPACFKTPENPSCTDLIFTKKPRFLQIKCVIETGLSDFHRMTISDDMHFRKLLLKSLITGIFKKLTMKGSWSPHSILSLNSRLITAKTLKKKYIRENNKPFMTKAYSKAIM